MLKPFTRAFILICNKSNNLSLWRVEQRLLRKCNECTLFQEADVSANFGEISPIFEEPGLLIFAKSTQSVDHSVFLPVQKLLN